MRQLGMRRARSLCAGKAFRVQAKPAAGPGGHEGTHLLKVEYRAWDFRVFTQTHCLRVRQSL